VTCLCYTTWVLWVLGYPDHALRRIHETLVFAQELSHPFSLAWALHFAARLHLFRRENHAAQERAEAVIALAREHGFESWEAEGTIPWGLALVEQGRGEEGITQLQRGLAAYRATGGMFELTYYLGLLAEAYRKTRQPEKGLAVLAEVLEMAEKTGEGFYEAELYRLKGELTLLQSNVQRLRSSVTTGLKSKVQGSRAKTPSTQHPTSSTQEAEACFHKALEVARRQQAKSLELRAGMSLVRLWQQQGKGKDAHGLLVEIYGWFTEGFDTQDLREAKALLEELSH